MIFVHIRNTHTWNLSPEPRTKCTSLILFNKQTCIFNIFYLLTQSRRDTQRTRSYEITAYIYTHIEMSVTSELNGLKWGLSGFRFAKARRGAREMRCLP